MPAGKDEATVYTARIWQKLVEACPCIVNNCDTCTDSTGQIKGKALFPLYIQNIIAHELGHMARPLVYPYTTKYEYHYKEGDYTIMERAIVATTDKKTKNVKIPISSQYKEADRSNVQIVR
jgi:hypothetical protein